MDQNSSLKDDVPMEPTSTLNEDETPTLETDLTHDQIFEEVQTIVQQEKNELLGRGEEQKGQNNTWLNNKEQKMLRTIFDTLIY